MAESAPPPEKENLEETVDYEVLEIKPCFVKLETWTIIVPELLEDITDTLINSSSIIQAPTTVPARKRRKYKRRQSNYPGYFCVFCSKTFPTRIQLDVHLVPHIEEKPFICLKCNKECGTVRGLRVHLKSHSQLKPYKCNLCESSFSRRESLQNHMDNHEKFKYSCVFCNKPYDHKPLFENHLLSHIEEKPHSCEQCGKAYGNKQLYTDHLRVHSGVRPFVCRGCGHTSRYSSDLVVHKKKCLAWKIKMELETGQELNIKLETK